MEAEFCIMVLGKWGPAFFPFPIWLDLEDEKWQGHVDINPIIDAFCTKMLQAGYKTGFYCDLDWYERKVAQWIKDKWDYWGAQYNDHHDAPLAVWQYTSKGSVPGIVGDVDKNICYKDYLPSGPPILVAPDIAPVLEPVYEEPVFSVLELQRVLRMLNFGPDLALDGVYGGETEKAVITAQKGYGISPDGIAGKVAEYYLRSQLRTVQNRLNEVGGYGVTVDGRLGDYGTETILALQNFQAVRNLTPDWIIGILTFDALFGPGIAPQPIPTPQPVGLPDGQITEHFARFEFACDCGGAYCNGFPVEISRTLVEKMEQVRQMLNAPIVITSGVRCEIRNAEVGGVPASQHKLGLACDFYTPGMSSAMVSHLAELCRSVGLYAIEYHDQLFVHAQI